MFVVTQTLAENKVLAPFIPTIFPVEHPERKTYIISSKNQIHTVCPPRVWIQKPNTNPTLKAVLCFFNFYCSVLSIPTVLKKRTVQDLDNGN
jgi:hypothetical protein